MKIRSALGAFFVTLATVCSCGPTVQQACQDYADAYCDRTYTCDTGAQLAAIQAQFGQTVDDCKAAHRTNCLGALSICPTGTTYDTGAAETCVANYRATPCDKITQPTYVPPGCATSDICH